MQYMKMKIPIIIIRLCIGFCGGIGLGSFIGGVTGSETFGYIGVVVGTIILFIVTYGIRFEENHKE